MIFLYMLQGVLLLITAVFSFLPVVTTLPTINGFDVDAQLSSAIGLFHQFVTAMWPIGDLFYYGVLPFIGYLAVKMMLRMFLGHRAPGSHA